MQLITVRLCNDPI